MMRKSILYFLACVALASCAMRDVPPAPKPGPIQPPPGGAAGYQHGDDRSRMSLGQDVHTIDELGFVKRVGSDGTLAILRTNGAALGIPNANAPSLRARPYGRTPQEHDAYVRTYFVQSGVPEEQVRSVRIATLLEARGESDHGSKAKPAVTGYYSVLERAIDGIAVPDSFAWARIAGSGEVVAEGIYWPALEASVIAEAKHLRGALSESSTQATLKAWLAEPLADASVTIRHASATYDGPFVSFASIDVLVKLFAPGDPVTTADQQRTRAGLGTGIVRHFNAQGGELFLPQETQKLDSALVEGKSKARNGPKP